MKPEGSDELSSLTEMLQNEEPIRLQWGAGSRIRIDRELPFLCIHRRSKPEVDGTAALLNSTASSLVVAPGDNPRPLLEKVVETYEPMFGAFFILEVWSKKALGIYPPPQFVIHPGRDPNSMRLAETLAEELARVSGKVPTEIEISNDRPRPTEMGPLLSKAFREEHRVVLLGLEVGALYQDADGKPYPALLRTFRRGLTNRLQKLLFEFSQNFTTYAPPNFQTLGPRAMVKLVWKVDEALEEISRRFSFLLQVTPTNISSAWLAFKRSKFEENPDFIYRPFPHDLTELKRELYALSLIHISEPTRPY